eukprot:g1105.t1
MFSAKHKYRVDDSSVKSLVQPPRPHIKGNDEEVVLYEENAPTIMKVERSDTEGSSTNVPIVNSRMDEGVSLMMPPSLAEDSPYQSIQEARWRHPLNDIQKMKELGDAAVWTGAYLWKVPYKNAGLPKVRWFKVVHDPKRAKSLKLPAQASFLQWQDGSQRGFAKARFVSVLEILEIVLGHRTQAFEASVSKHGINAVPPPELSFSLITKKRTVDLAATNVEERDIWVNTLEELKIDMNKLVNKINPPVRGVGGRNDRQKTNSSSLSFFSSKKSSSAADSRIYIKISGAGSAEANGTYFLCEGIREMNAGESEAPCYRNEETGMMLSREKIKKHYGWIIGKIPLALYGIRTSEMLPPKRGWKKYGGKTPVPTITMGPGKHAPIPYGSQKRQSSSSGHVKNNSDANHTSNNRSSHSTRPGIGNQLNAINNSRPDRKLKYRTAPWSPNKASQRKKQLLRSRSEENEIILDEVHSMRRGRQLYDSSEWSRTVFDCVRQGRINDIVNILEQGCDIDIMDPASGDTILMLACRLGQEDIVHIALDRKARNDPHPHYGQTALQAAIQHGQASCASIILEAAAKHGKMDVVIVNHADEEKNAPLHVSARSGDVVCVELLLMHGADYSLVDAEGRTALHLASMFGHMSCAALLLECGSDELLEIGDHHGNTPLHVAAAYGNEKIVKLLLETAADPRSINIDGKTPLHVAMEKEMLSCVTLLQKQEQVVVGTPRMAPLFTRCLRPGEEIPSGNLPLPISQYQQQNLNYQTMPPMPISNGIEAPHQINHQQNTYRSPVRPNLNLDTSWQSEQSENNMSSSAIHQNESFDSAVASPAAEDKWEIHYTDDGHRYFVNVTTGVSQWEDPRESPSHSSQPQHSYDSHDHHHYGTNGYDYYSGYPQYHEQGVVQGAPQQQQQPEHYPQANQHHYYESYGDYGSSGQQQYGQGGEMEYTGASGAGDDSWNNTTSFLSFAASQTVEQEIDHNGQKPAIVPKLNLSSIHKERAEENGTSTTIETIDDPPMATADNPHALLMASIKNRGKTKTKAESAPATTTSENHSKNTSTNQQQPNSNLLKKYARFHKMSKMGVPEGAVRHKMLTEGIDEAEIEKFIGALQSNSSTSPPPPPPPPSSKISPNKEADAQKARASDEVRNRPEFAQYKKMQKYGLADGAVRNKMQKDGVSPELIDAYFGTVKTKPESVEKVQSDADIERARLKKKKDAEEKKQKLRADKAYAKYVRMEKMGLPEGAIRHKMTMEGIETANIDLFFGKSLEASASESQEAKVPKLKLAKLHWKSLPSDKLEKSVWGKNRNSGLEEEDLGELQSLFAKSNSPKNRKKTETKKKKTKKSLIEFKRANNVSIMLAQFKAFASYDELLNSVISLDASKLSVGKLTTLAQALPTEREIKTVSFFKGNVDTLNKAEKFFIAVGKNDHNIAAYVDAMLFRLQAEDAIDKVYRKVELMGKACVTVVESSKLARVLESILAIGKVMNQGKDVGGFTLDSLLSLGNTKSADKKTTLLDYLVRTVERKDPEIMTFPDDFKIAQEASKVLFPELERDYREVKMRLRKFIQTAKAAKAAGSRKTKVDEGKQEVDEKEQEEDEEKEDAGDAGNPQSMLMAAIRNAGKKKKKKKANNVIESKCEPADATLSDEIQTFISTVEDSLAKLELKFESTKEQMLSLTEYFGEDSKKAGHTLEVIHKFSVIFEGAVQIFNRKKARAEREAKSKLEKEKKKKAGNPKKGNVLIMPKMNAGMSVLAEIKAKGGMRGLKKDIAVRRKGSETEQKSHKLHDALKTRLLLFNIDDLRSEEDLESWIQKLLARFSQEKLYELMGSENDEFRTVLEEMGISFLTKKAREAMAEISKHK